MGVNQVFKNDFLLKINTHNLNLFMEELNSQNSLLENVEDKKVHLKRLLPAHLNFVKK